MSANSKFQIRVRQIDHVTLVVRDVTDRRAREIGAKEAAERAAEQARREADDRARAEAEALKAQGIPLIDDAKLRPDGAVQVFFADPDHHVVELCSSPRR